MDGAEIHPKLKELYSQPRVPVVVKDASEASEATERGDQFCPQSRVPVVIKETGKTVENIIYGENQEETKPNVSTEIRFGSNTLSRPPSSPYTLKRKEKLEKLRTAQENIKRLIKDMSVHRKEPHTDVRKATEVIVKDSLESDVKAVEEDPKHTLDGCISDPVSESARAGYSQSSEVDLLEQDDDPSTQGPTTEVGLESVLLVLETTQPAPAENPAVTVEPSGDSGSQERGVDEVPESSSVEAQEEKCVDCPTVAADARVEESVSVALEAKDPINIQSRMPPDMGTLKEPLVPVYDSMNGFESIAKSAECLIVEVEGGVRDNDGKNNTHEPVIKPVRKEADRDVSERHPHTDTDPTNKLDEGGKSLTRIHEHMVVPRDSDEETESNIEGHNEESHEEYAWRMIKNDQKDTLLQKKLIQQVEELKIATDELKEMQRQFQIVRNEDTPGYLEQVPVLKLDRIKENSTENPESKIIIDEGGNLDTFDSTGQTTTRDIQPIKQNTISGFFWRYHIVPIIVAAFIGVVVIGHKERIATNEPDPVIVESEVIPAIPPVVQTRATSVEFCDASNLDEIIGLDVMKFRVPRRYSKVMGSHFLADTMREEYNPFMLEESLLSENPQYHCMVQGKGGFSTGFTYYYEQPSLEMMYRTKKSMKRLKAATPAYTGFFVKFVNLSRKPILLFAEGDVPSAQTLVGKIPPFESFGLISETPGQVYTVTPTYDKWNPLDRWVVTKRDPIHYYEPSSQTHSWTGQEQHQYEMQKLNQAFGSAYAVVAGRPWLGNFPRAFGEYLWPAEYLGQTHRIDGYNVRVVSISPRVLVIDHFESQEEIEERAAFLLNVDHAQFGSVKVTQYQVGESMNSHYDLEIPSQFQHDQSSNFATVLWNLSETETELVFPRAVNVDSSEGIAVKVKKGSMVLIYNMLLDGNMDENALYGTKPNLEGSVKIASMAVWDGTV